MTATAIRLPEPSAGTTGCPCGRAEALLQAGRVEVASVGVGAVHLIRNETPSSLAGLRNIDAAGWLMISQHDALTDLAGLEGITSLAERVAILNNPALRSLSALGGITGAVANVEIRNNTVLGDLAGLEGITSVTGGLDILDSPALESVSALGGVTGAIGGLEVRKNTVLTDLAGLEGITSVVGSLDILDNPALADLSGLANISSVAYCVVNGNTALAQCEVDAWNAGVTTTSGPPRVTPNGSTDSALCE